MQKQRRARKKSTLGCRKEEGVKRKRRRVERG